jgi:TonB-linked SusC/RagA family outer membrane protein
MQMKKAICMGIPLMLMGVMLCAQPDIRKKGTKEKTKEENTNVTENVVQLDMLKGKVVDDKNEAVAGATVAVIDKSTGAVVTGTYTDDKGEFTVLVDLSKGKYAFKVSYVGYRSGQVDIEGAGKSYDFVLVPDVVGIEEVVITALNMQEKKANLGFSVQEVKGKELIQSGEANVVQSLSSKAAGIQVIQSTGVPGASSKILIRGNASITGENQPLFIIDGVPMDNSTNTSGNPYDGSNNLLKSTPQSNRAIDINPEDIESITILKGPAASALYGTRAGYGAIVITTKKGAKSNGINIEVGNTLEFSSPNRLDPIQKKYSQGLNGKFIPPTTISGAPNMRFSYGASLDTLQGKRLVPVFDNFGNIIDSTTVQVYDNQKNFFETGVGNTTTFSLSNGNEVSSYRISTSYLTQNGIVPNSSFNRGTFRVTTSNKILNKINIFTTVNYTNSAASRVQHGSNLSGVMLGLLRTPCTFDNSAGYEVNGIPRRFAVSYDNPFWSVYKNPFTDKVNRVITSNSTSYDILNWLNVTQRIGTDFYTDRRKQIYHPLSREQYGAGGMIYEEIINHQEVYNDLLITLKKQFNEKLFGSILLGQNLNTRFDQKLYMQGTGLGLKDFYNISNASNFFSSEITTKVRTMAFFTDMKLEYNNMVFLNITGRAEKASTFGVSKNMFFFPSASLGFVFTELEALKENKILPFGKIRVAFSSVGHEPFAYATQTLYTSAAVADGWTSGLTFPYNGQSGFLLSDVAGNPKLKPERLTGQEIGLDLRFYENRVGIDFTWYNQVTKDAIFSVPVARSSGFYAYITNAGQVQNKGIELVLNAKPVRKENFVYSVDLNFTRNRNTVKTLAPGVESVFLGGFEGSDARAVAGQPYSALYGNTWMMHDGKIVVDEYGYPIMDPIYKPIGDPNPKWLAGLRNTFTYKDINFSFLFDIRKGGDIWNGTLGALNYFGTSLTSATREVKNGKIGQIPLVNPPATINRGDSILVDGVVFNPNTGQYEPNKVKVAADQDWYRYIESGFFGPASQFVQDGSWIRLREVYLSYTLKGLNVKYLSKMEISFTGRNLWLYAPNFEGIDPETSLTGAGNNANGLTYFNLPNTRSFIFGVKVFLN